MDDATLKGFIGTEITRQTVVVERSAVAFFADAVLDTDPIYRDATVAAAAGFDGLPVPPTFPFVMGNWGAFAELQPEGAPGTGLGIVLGALMAGGGLILHGEQAFTYHAPVVTGQVLNAVGVIKDIYVKESKGSTMTFVVAETTWSDATTGEAVCTTTFNIIHRI